MAPPLAAFPEPEGEMPSAALANYYRRRRDLNTDGVDLFCFTGPVACYVSCMMLMSLSLSNRWALAALSSQRNW